MKKILFAFLMLMASFSTASADSKNIIICYVNDIKIVFENVQYVAYGDGGSVHIKLENEYGQMVLSGIYTCLEVENNNKLVKDMKERFGGR